MGTRGGNKGYVQYRAIRESEWTLDKRARFLDVLAATCNVAEASRAVGMSFSGAYGLRARDGEFALLWAEAFALGEERLREELIGVALAQVASANNPSGDRVMADAAPFDPTLALKVLQLRAQVAPGGNAKRRKMPSQHEVDAALLARFEALDRQKLLGAPAPCDGAGDQAGIEGGDPGEAA